MKHAHAFVTVMISFLALGTTQGAPPANLYTTAMYRHAFTNHSTAPDYILITVTDGRSGASTVICTVTDFLIGALNTEYGLPYDRCEKMALHNPNRVFVFSNPKALANVAPDYTPEILDAVRKAIRSKTDDDLLKTDFIQTLRFGKSVIAHALLERGISCILTDRPGNLRPYKGLNPIEQVSKTVP